MHMRIDSNAGTPPCTTSRLSQVDGVQVAFGRRRGHHYPRFLLSLEGISQPVEYPGCLEHGGEDVYNIQYL